MGEMYLWCREALYAALKLIGALASGNTYLWCLGAFYVALKLIGVLDWSWWVVTLPFWITPALLLVTTVGAVVLAFISSNLIKVTHKK